MLKINIEFNLEISEDELNQAAEISGLNREDTIKATEKLFRDNYNIQVKEFQSYNPTYTFTIYDTLDPLSNKEDILYCKYCDYLQRYEDRITGEVEYRCLRSKDRLNVKVEDKCHHNYKDESIKNNYMN